MRLFLLLLCLLLPVCAGQCAPASPALPTSLPALKSRADFDRMARVTLTPYRLPHLLFVIDRQDRSRVYYVNSKRFQFHREFVNATYLSLDTGKTFFENNYLKADRRFLMGTVAYQTPVKQWTFEFWEGDPIDGTQIADTAKLLQATFFAPLKFKPNSLRQEELSATLPRLLPRDISISPDYLPLSLARAVGRLHLLPHVSDDAVLNPEDILVCDGAPVTLPPLSGLITTRPATPLSHINLRARSLGLPDAFIRDAAGRFAKLNGQWVVFETQADKYTLTAATPAQIRAKKAQAAARQIRRTPRADLSHTALASLSEQRAADVSAYGAKSANLGEVAHAALPGLSVPPGFTLPFAAYQQFLDENRLGPAIDALLRDPRVPHAPAYRRTKLTALRAQIQAGHLSAPLQATVLARVRANYAGLGLFVRSSTNAEDLPDFVGAGLYTTVPNVRGETALTEAIKTVWASVWNLEAFDARMRAGIDHRKVYMAVLIQVGINAESAGVLITTDPYNPANKGAVYVSAKRGLGIKVVDGVKVAEQLLYRPASNAVRVLTRSGEDSLLEFDANGGVKETAIVGPRTVLTDDVVRRLSRAALAIKGVFGGRDQDIEWAYLGGTVYIVQSRPFVDPSHQGLLK